MKFDEIRVRGMYIMGHGWGRTRLVAVLGKDEAKQEIRVRVVGSAEVVRCAADELTKSYTEAAKQDKHIGV